MDLELIKNLKKSSNKKIVYLIIDGLGGLPLKKRGKTELETANTPNLDKLASEGICGLQQPVAPGITPGSGPGHLSLFGYDSIKYKVRRGVLSALGIDFDLQHGDIAARGNFCTVDENNRVKDRRAGRISTEKNQELCKILREIKIPGVEVFVETVKEYRFLLVFRGKNLSPEIKDTDPQEIGKKPLEPEAFDPKANRTRDLVSMFIDKAREKLKNHHPANMILLRGFSKKPDWADMEEIYGLKSAAIAAYPMYRGVSKLIGMDVLPTGEKIQDEFDTLEKNWNKYDFFYLHIKKSDSAGEDGDFKRKVKEIEKVDKQISRILDLDPAVLVVTGDHSTPAYLKYHSWHPVPVILHSDRCRTDNVKTFGERECIKGGLGPNFPAKNLMSLCMANADRLSKLGA